jgi:hypothetical protein
VAKQSIKVDPNLINPDRKQFDEDIAYLKKRLTANEEGKLRPIHRGLPIIADIKTKELEDRGIDVQGMLGGKAAVAEDYAKGGKVSSASKRADGCCKRGKTRGKMY